MSQRKYTIDFTCNFQLNDYPFDVQKCFMNFKLKKPTSNVAKLVLLNANYAGGEDLLEYRVMNTTMAEDYPCGN